PAIFSRCAWNEASSSRSSACAPWPGSRAGPTSTAPSTWRSAWSTSTVRERWPVPELPGARGVPEKIVVIGVTDPLTPTAAKALSEADLVVGSGRLLQLAGAGSAFRRLVLGAGGAGLAGAVDALAAEKGRVSVPASG